MTLYIDYVETGQKQIEFCIPMIVLENKIRKLSKAGYTLEEFEYEPFLNDNPKACVRFFKAYKH